MTDDSADKPAAKNGSDPWSDMTWGEKILNVTLDSDIFDFSVGQASSLLSPDLETQSFLFPSDPIWGTIKDEDDEEGEGVRFIRVAIHEQLSAVYDDVSKEPVCHVRGSIHIKPTSSSISGSDPPDPFCLVVRDLLDNIAHLETNSLLCTNVSDSANRTSLHKSDRILRVWVPSDSNPEDEISIATYVCTSKLRPVPMVCTTHSIDVGFFGDCRHQFFGC
jgi:hypothetical protein